MDTEKGGAAAVFLDRDGTINHDLVEYITDPKQFELLDGVGQALRRLSAGGYKLVVVTNQACLAKGLIDEASLKKVHDRMKALLATEGVKLDGIYYCGDHPEGVVQQYRRESERRKPEPGMLLEAAEELGIDLSKSWMVGDKTGDAQAGSRAGCRTVLLVNPEEQASGGNEPPDTKAADFTAGNLLEAAEVIIRQDIGKEESEQAEAKKSPRARPQPLDIRRMLSDILRELRHQRVGPGSREFPVSKMMAGMAQCLVFLCLVLSYVAFSQWGGDALWACLMVGLILQTMVVALLLWHR